MSVPDAVAGRVRHAQRGYGRAWLRYPLFIALVAAAYYAAAELVYALEVAGPVAAVLWLPAGVGIAALYLGGLRLWPGVLIADLLVNDYGVLPLGTALAQTAGHRLRPPKYSAAIPTPAGSQRTAATGPATSSAYTSSAAP